jgi:hypothetical protein
MVEQHQRSIDMPSPTKDVKSWAPVPAKLCEWRESIAGLEHIHTAFLPPRDRSLRRRGTTLWATEFDDSRVGLVWEWAELQGQIVVMVNPMAVITNLTLLDELGRPLNLCARACSLNSAIYGLPWQERITQTH